MEIYPYQQNSVGLDSKTDKNSPACSSPVSQLPFPITTNKSIYSYFNGLNWFQTTVYIWLGINVTKCVKNNPWYTLLHQLLE